MTKQKKNSIITQIEPPFHCEHERELTNEKIDDLVQFLLVCEIKKNPAVVSVLSMKGNDVIFMENREKWV